jgi:hypothetical protein
MVDSIRVAYKLTTLQCIDEGDGLGNAEPYMWTVYFKVDGDTVVLDNNLMLSGTATVVGTPGNHGDLPDDVDAGDTVSIPSSLGSFATTLRPIPTPFPGVTAGGMIGCIAIVMEEDSTPDQDIANGHAALNQELQNQLDALIPTLGVNNPSPSDADIAAIQAAVQTAVEDAVAEGVDFWDFLAGLFGNLQDDQIGTAKFIFSHDQLDAHAGGSFPLSKHWSNEGSWTLNGNVKVDKKLVAGISRSGDWGNIFLYGRTTDDFLTESQQLFDKDGLRIVHLETWKDHQNVRRWASIHRTGNWGSQLQVGLDTAAFVSQVAANHRKGLELLRMVNWVDDKSPLWAGIWRTGLDYTEFHHGLDTAAFLQLTQDLFDQQDLRMTQAIHYEDAGKPMWAGIYLKGDWAHRFYIRDDLSSFVTTAQDFFDKDKLRIVDFETWIEGGARRYAGISRSGDWASRLFVHRGEETFLEEAQEAFDKDGLRLIDVDVYEA